MQIGMATRKTPAMVFTEMQIQVKMLYSTYQKGTKRIKHDTFHTEDLRKETPETITKGV